MSIRDTKDNYLTFFDTPPGSNDATTPPYRTETTFRRMIYLTPITIFKPFIHL